MEIESLRVSVDGKVSKDEEKSEKEEMNEMKKKKKKRKLGGVKTMPFILGTLFSFFF